MCTVVQDVPILKCGQRAAERPEPGETRQGVSPQLDGAEGGCDRAAEGSPSHGRVSELRGTEEFRVLTSDSYAGPGDAGRTGSWRVLRPVIDYSKCTPAKTGKPACFLCWLFCPDSVVSKTVKPAVDLEYCKGCGICAEECPAKAITMVEESSCAREDPA